MPACALRHKLLVFLSCRDCHNKVDITDLLKVDLVRIVPASIVKILSEQLICTLYIPFVRVRHVEVIDEENLMLFTGWLNQRLGLLL